MGNALNKYKVKHLIIENDKSISEHPKAHYISPRTAEIYKNINLSESIDKYNYLKNIENWKHYRYCEYLLKPESYYGEINHFRPSNIFPFIRS